MTNRVTVIGNNSFLSKALQKNPAGQGWRYIGHEEALSETDWIGKTDTLINCAFHPDFHNDAYSPIKDINFMLAGYVQIHPVHYIMLSSRAVYGEAPASLILRENHPASPDTPYAKNKYASEQALTKLLPPERLTILRMGNIFGAERERPTFFGQMLSGLLDEGVIHFDIAPDAVRDFLAAERWADYIAHIAAAPKAGLYNIGAGFGITTQELAEEIMKANSSGRVEYTGQSYKGQFILDVSKAQAAFNLEPYTKDDLKKDCEAALRASV